MKPVFLFVSLVFHMGVSLQVAFARICTFPVDMMLTWICRICICSFFQKGKDEFYYVFDNRFQFFMARKQLAWFERVPKGRRRDNIMTVKLPPLKRFELSIVQTCSNPLTPFFLSCFLHFFFHGSHKIFPLSIRLTLTLQRARPFPADLPLLISSLPFNLRGLFPTSAAHFQTPPRVIPVCHLLPLQSRGFFCPVAKRVPNAGLFSVHKGVLLSATLLCTG